MATRADALRQGAAKVAIPRIRAALALFVLTLAFVLGGAGTGAAATIPSPTGATATTTPGITYDATFALSSQMVVERGRGSIPTASAALTVREATGDHAGIGAVFVAAETADGALDASELSAGQASNYARYAKKLPSGAQDPVITRAANGSVQFSADVPGRVPGSYATYTKIVDSGGTTTDYYKTTVAPDGSIIHVKIKFP